MQESIIKAIVHSLVSVVVLFIFARLAGKKQISQLSFFHYVIGISIGSIAAAFAVDTEIQFPEFLTSVIIYGLFPLVLSQINIHSYRGRKIINGSPTILIQDGKIIHENLRKTHISIDELLEECRLKNAFNVLQVEFAILETNGQVSVQMKPDSLPLTPKDMQIPTNYQGLCANIIIDGHIIKENLECIEKNKKWLYDELGKIGVVDISNILLAFTDHSEKLFIYRKGDSPKLKSVI